MTLSTTQSPSTRRAVLLPVLLALTAAHGAHGQAAWIQNAIATNYGSAYDGMDPWQPSFGTSRGSCGYGQLDKSEWPFWSVAGISVKNPFYLAGPQEACGMCFEVQCVNNKTGSLFAGRCYSGSANNSIIVQITDKCPECEAQHFDVQALTFAKLAPMAIGRIDIRYRPVPCHPPAGMSLNVMNGQSGSGFFKFTVGGVAGRGTLQQVQVSGTPAPNQRSVGWVNATPTVKVEGHTPDGPTTQYPNRNRKLLQTSTTPVAGQNLTNQYGAAWQIDQMPPPPLSFRFVVNGSQVTAINSATKDQLNLSSIVPMSVQFSSGTTTTGASGLGSGIYGNGPNPSCSVTQFYNMTSGSVPKCANCVLHQPNLDATLQCFPPLMVSGQRFFCKPLPVTAIALDKSSTANCLLANATTHKVLIQRSSTLISYAYTDIQSDVSLRANSKTLMKAQSVRQTTSGLEVTFSDPTLKVGKLMATRKLRPDGLYVEGRIRPGGGHAICFSSDQSLTLRMC